MKAITKLWKYYLYDTKLVHKFLSLLVVLLLIEIIVSNFLYQKQCGKIIDEGGT